MTTHHTPIYLYTDGGSRGNPGPAAIGVVLQQHDGKIIQTYKEYIGETTNNQAEYRALIKGLELALHLGYEEVHAHLDSELVVKQLRQEYKVKQPDIQRVFVLAWNLAQSFKKVVFKHVPRAMNTKADALVNEALDAQG